MLSARMGPVLDGFTVQPVTETPALTSRKAGFGEEEDMAAVPGTRGARYDPRTPYEGPAYLQPSTHPTCGALSRPPLRPARRGTPCRRGGCRTHDGARASPQTPSPAPEP